MIKEFVAAWEKGKDNIREEIKKRRPRDYKTLVEIVVSEIAHQIDDEGIYYVPCAKRIHQIDDGHYQGTLVFVIGDSSYQPFTYWYCKIRYGSCSACDTLQAIVMNYGSYEGEELEDFMLVENERKLGDLMRLCLHIVQELKEM